VLYVGSNKPHKNLASLVQAWGGLARDQLAGADLRLIIAGREDPRYTSARVLAGQLRLDASVRFMPDVPDADLPALLGGAECFVFPSYQEGFGLPPLEAMACGTPVVASNRSSLPEVIGDAGLLVEPEPDSLAVAIRHMLQDEELRAHLRARGLARAGQFSWKRTAAATLEVYKQLAG
jgi:alpha-1,3-rhamnosyl/mannosyltransferase